MLICRPPASTSYPSAMGLVVIFYRVLSRQGGANSFLYTAIPFSSRQHEENQLLRQLRQLRSDTTCRVRTQSSKRHVNHQRGLGLGYLGDRHDERETQALLLSHGQLLHRGTA